MTYYSPRITYIEDEWIGENHVSKMYLFDVKFEYQDSANATKYYTISVYANNGSWHLKIEGLKNNFVYRESNIDISFIRCVQSMYDVQQNVQKLTASTVQVLNRTDNNDNVDN